MSIAINQSRFEKEVMENSRLSLVHFKTDWSGACQIISPVYEELARSYASQARFFSIDIEQEPEMEKEFGILELPTILFFKGGLLVDHAIGLIPKTTLINKIEKALI